MIGPAASRGRVEKLSVTAASRDSDVFLEMHFHFPHPMCSIHNLGHLHLAFHVIFYCCHLYHSFMFWACSWKLKYDINQSSYKFYQDENEKAWFREFLQCLITVVINVEMFPNCGYFFVWRNIHISIFFSMFPFLCWRNKYQMEFMIRLAKIGSEISQLLDIFQSFSHWYWSFLSLKFQWLNSLDLSSAGALEYPVEWMWTLGELLLLRCWEYTLF